MYTEKSNQSSSHISISNENNTTNSLNNNGLHASLVTLENEYQLKIIKILGLKNGTESEIMAKMLLIKGRQALCNYEQDILPDIYLKAMSFDQTELYQTLKEYFDRQLTTTTDSWFQTFLHEQKSISPKIYDQLLSHASENGLEFLQHSCYLSLTIRLLFDFNKQVEPSFERIWNTSTTRGLRGIKEYQDYIAVKVNERLFQNDRNPLYLALDDYYREPLIKLFKQENININQPVLIEQAMNCVVNQGWWNGLHDRAIRDELPPRVFQILINSLPSISHSSSMTRSITAASTPQLARLSSTIEKTASTSPIGSSVEGKSDMKFMNTTTIQETTSPMTSLSTVDKPNTSPICARAAYDNCQQNEPLPTTADTLVQNRMEEAAITKEKETISNLIGQEKKLKLSDLVQAGELIYMDKNLDQVIHQIMVDYQSNRNFSSFIDACFIPLMYLLKRHQNLDDFIDILFLKYSELPETLTSLNLSLRMFIDHLLARSDLSLSGRILSLLSQRNPVPFLQPSSRFVSDIIHVWDYSIPTILSFGIGSCQGKSLLLNRIFLSSFEQSIPSLYFENTIDIDFGYNFLPRRSMNIADAHGSMTQSLLEQIHQLFDGFLIHIQESYLWDNLFIVHELLNLVKNTKKYQLLIIRDVPNHQQDECRKRLSTEFSRIETFLLSDVTDHNKKESKNCITVLRDQLFEQIPKTCLHPPGFVKEQLWGLIDIDYQQHLIQLSKIIAPLNNHLLDLIKNSTLLSNYFPEYLQFVELCELKLKLARLNFYGIDDDAVIYEHRRRIYQLENVSKNNHGPCSIIYQLFCDISRTSDSLTCLDMIATELKQQRSQLISTSDMAMQLSIEKSLSLEVLWRNAIVCSQYQSENEQKLLQEKYYQFILAGYPFEIVDGDNFHFQYSFLSQALAPLRNNRILVISVIGPQNSGKSTLLNYLFGTLFDVRDGRCTRGIYGSLAKSKQPDYDYILLIDTEGLLGVEREDKEYDRRIVLFCLAISHIVLVNMVGEVSATLQEMLKLCADSLAKMGKTRTSQAIVHFILNQKVDLNIENSRASILRIISQLKSLDLGLLMNIGLETFHTLPSAFKKEGQTLTSKSTYINQIKTTPDFIENVQLLAGKLFRSIQTLEMSNFSQWFSSSVSIFETLQKSADLTYYRDIHEQRSDHQVREHIRETLLKIFSADYRDQLILQTSNKTADEIQEIFLREQNQIETQTEHDLEGLFKLLRVSNEIRSRNKQFLRVQISEMFNTLRTSTSERNRREQVNKIIRHAEKQFRQIIENVSRSGKLMSRDTAEKEFEQMYQNTMKFIQDGFKLEECLQQAMKYIHTNYQIYEKDCTLEFSSIILHSSLLTNQPSSDNFIEAFASRFTRLAYKKPAVITYPFNPTETCVYSLDIINSLMYLNRTLLKHEFQKFVHPSTPPTQNSNKRFTATTINSLLNHHSNEGIDEHPNRMSTDQFQMKIRTAFEKQIGLNGSDIDEEKFYLGLSGIIREVIQRIVQTMQGVNNGQVKQIRTQLIQKIVGLINSLIIDLRNELSPFCLELSTDFKSIIHTLSMITLTKYYLDEQINHFDQIRSDFERKKVDLKSYFIANACTNNSRDKNYALNLIQQLKDQMIQSLLNDGQRIIFDDSKQYECLNRKSIQDHIDGQLEVNNDRIWYFDYISNPTKMIEQYFIKLWIDVKKAIDGNLLQRKIFYMKITREFFYCIQGMLDSVRPSKFSIAEIFQPEKGYLSSINEDRDDATRCMVKVLYYYMAEQKILSVIKINQNVYRLRDDALRAFQSSMEQRRPSDELANIIKTMSSVFRNLSIHNLIAFLEGLLSEQEKILNDLNEAPCDFDHIDRNDTYARLLDKVRGCSDLCPCCRRPCDVDHTQLKSKPGSQYNQHRCQSGHTLRAMNGYKFEVTDEPSLSMCEQIKDDQVLVIGSQRYQWSDFKRQHPDWAFQSTLNEEELNRLHGKFLSIWNKIGKELCKKYQMKYVQNNTTLSFTHQSFHYILLLDGSGSMAGQRWKDLVNAVQEFLKRRLALNTNDRVSIIVFTKFAKIVCSNEMIQHINIDNISHPGGLTCFREAFKCVNTCLTNSMSELVSNSVNKNIGIIFMSDGEAEYPDYQLKKLIEEHGSVIKRFWTIALGDRYSSSWKVLDKINIRMNGSFMDISTSAELTRAYAEVANIKQ